MICCISTPLRMGVQAWLALSLFSIANADQPATATLRLQGGDYASGEWVESTDKGVIRWRHPAFKSPLTFSTAVLESITYPGAAGQAKAVGTFAVDLHNGDRIYGDWVGADERLFRFQCGEWGEIPIEREAIRRISRWNDGERFIYSGPHSLEEWSTSGTEDSPTWSMQGSGLASETAGSVISRDCQLPSQATIALELAWEGEPHFVIALGVPVDRPEDRGAARLEVWNREVVLLRELANKADVVAVQSIAKDSDSLKLTLFLDQAAGQVVALSPTGKRLAAVSLPSDPTEVHPGIRVENTRGALQLRKLVVLRGHDQSMMQGASTEQRIVKKDGETMEGTVQSIDADARTLTLVRDETPATIPLSDIDNWYGASPEEADESASPKVAPNAGPEPGIVRLNAHDTTQISGQLLRLEEGQIWIQPTAIAEPLSLPLARVNAVSHDAKSEGAPTKASGRTGRLETAGSVLRGVLVDSANAKASGDGTGGQNHSPLAWHPHGAVEPVALAEGVSGRIVYREPPPPRPEPQPVGTKPRRQAQQGFVGGLARFFAGEVTVPKVGERSVTLRTGDTIPAEIREITENELTIRSEKTESSVVKPVHVKAVELNGGHAMQLDAEKRTRLLTVPRMLRNDPPTHVIVSTSGDFLRGRLISLGGEFLEFETRLRAISIPRNLVARIIWLHPQDYGKSVSASDATAPDGDGEADTTDLVQAVRSDRTRITFHPERLEDETLYGRSAALGPCRVQLASTDILVFGERITEEAQELPYGEWELVYAPDPAVLSDDGDPSTGASPGTRSELVGEPAPDFTLPLLTGGKFHLEEHRGRVIVLDFWASWCGPCMQAMPQIDETVGALADQGVDLVSVNLQEPAETIRAALERLGIEPTVVLDRDGAVAQRYRADAIPQTVIIDREGNIARLFIGAGPRFAEQLRTAIEETLK